MVDRVRSNLVAFRQAVLIASVADAVAVAAVPPICRVPECRAHRIHSFGRRNGRDKDANV